jgi:cyanophycinase
MQHQPTRNAGSLVVIGGNEDREHDKPVLKRIIELTEKVQPRVMIITAASAEPDLMWEAYDGAFHDLGVHHRQRLDLPDREAANRASSARAISEADVVFMTGGDQVRLMSVLNGSTAAAVMLDGFHNRHLCIAGTSAGASVMSDHMVAGGETKSPPTKDMVTLAAGLGLLHGVVIDQHFSERGRLPRLLSALAQKPTLLGLGIDEDTALVVRPFDSIEVVGSGAVTAVDGSCMRFDCIDAHPRQALQLERVVVHLLPAGGRYHLNDCKPPSQVREQIESCGIAELVAVLTTLPPPR